MPNRDQMFQTAKQGVRNVRFADLVALMEAWGFNYRLGASGDNGIFVHPTHHESASTAKPHHGPVKPVYVRACLAAIGRVKNKERG